MLESAQRLWGELPLVLFTDNGPPYKSADFLAFLERHHIVHVPNLPHTPQHNAAAERMNRDVKDASELGKGTRITSLDDAARSLLAGVALVNVRPRGVLDGESALVRHLLADRWYTPEHRKEIHDTARAAVDAVPRDIGTPRQYRLARRRAALEVLHALGIIHITRGCGPS